MGLELIRVDDRLLHGQVVVGWGQRLDLRWYLVADDELAESEWEQQLYRDALPPGTEAEFVGVEAASDRVPRLSERPEAGALLTRGTGAMRRLAEAGVLEDRRVDVGCVGAGSGRKQLLAYVHLSPDEAEDLRRIRSLGAEVVARDVPSARPVSLDVLLERLNDD